MSAFEALRVTKIYEPTQPSLSREQLVAIISRVHADATALDFEAALQLVDAITTTTPADAEAFYRHCIEQLIVAQRPVWAKIMTRGRHKFIQKLSRDERQCFRGAGLLVDPPTMMIIQWWDRVTALVRLTSEQAKLERARFAEQLTLQFETDRLRKAGINRVPKWIAIEDNTAGYDVLSYDPGEVEPTNRLIEVKSTIASPLRFNLTRNEWDQAVRFGDSYSFHIWDLNAQPPRLFARTVKQVAPHVPSDNQEGEWRNAEIPVSAS